MIARANFDGGCRIPLGPDRKQDISRGIAAGAAVLYDEHGALIASAARFMLSKTVNESEWTGLLLALEIALKAGVTHLDVYGDSELVVRQARGDYKVRKAHLQPYYDEAQQLGFQFQRVKIHECEKAVGKRGSRRNTNERADSLASECMDLRGSFYRGLL